MSQSVSTFVRFKDVLGVLGSVGTCILLHDPTLTCYVAPSLPTYLSARNVEVLPEERLQSTPDSEVTRRRCHVNVVRRVAWLHSATGSVWSRQGHRASARIFCDGLSSANPRDPRH